LGPWLLLLAFLDGMGWDGMDECRGDDESLQNNKTQQTVINFFNRNATVPGQHRVRNYLKVIWFPIILI